MSLLPRNQGKKLSFRIPLANILALSASLLYYPLYFRSHDVIVSDTSSPPPPSDPAPPPYSCATLPPSQSAAVDDGTYEPVSKKCHSSHSLYDKRSKSK